MVLPAEIQNKVDKEHFTQNWKLGSMLLYGAMGVGLPFLQWRRVSLVTSLGGASLISALHVALFYYLEQTDRYGHEYGELEHSKIALITERLDSHEPTIARALLAFPELYQVAKGIEPVDAKWVQDQIAEYEPHRSFLAGMETAMEIARPLILGACALFISGAALSRLTFGHRYWQNWLALSPLSALSCALSMQFYGNYQRGKLLPFWDTLEHRVSATLRDELEKDQSLSEGSVALLEGYCSSIGDRFPDLDFPELSDGQLERLVEGLYTAKSTDDGFWTVSLLRSDNLTQQGILKALARVPTVGRRFHLHLPSSGKFRRQGYQ